MRFPIANATTPGSTNAAVAAGNTMRRSIWISTIHNTATAPIDPAMLLNNLALVLPLLSRAVGAESLLGRMLDLLGGMLKQPTA